jgi:cbb3-type cytochrome oxidase subunit 3
MKRHPLDPFSLIFGIMFAVLGGLLLNTHIDIAALSGLWLLALPLFFLGLLFVAFGLNRVRRVREDAPEAALEDASEEPILK